MIRTVGRSNLRYLARQPNISAWTKYIKAYHDGLELELDIINYMALQMTKEYPWSVKTQMGDELWSAIHKHPQAGEWQQGWGVGIGLMLNSASHPEGSEALSMVSEDVVRAYKANVPLDVLKLAIHHVSEWRTLLLETQPSDEIIEGNITAENLKKELASVLPAKYLSDLFDKPDSTT